MFKKLNGSLKRHMQRRHAFQRKVSIYIYIYIYIDIDYKNSKHIISSFLIP